MVISASSAAPTLPVINTNNIVSITSFGAVSSTTLTNTAAIQSTIDSAATTNGGCTVEIPAGTYLSGPLTMRSGINLQLDSGAILRMLPYGSYPGSGNLIGATNVNDIEISGSGAIDGQGSAWWTAFQANSSLDRPIMVRFQGCNRQLIQTVTLSNSPMFHMSFSGSKGNITVQGVTVQSPPSSASPPAKNTDACDVSGTNILVQNCHISVGDDDFTCGGGTSDVLITNNTYGNGHGVSIGSYTQGVSNIMVINCTFSGTDNGIRIKSDNDRSGLVRNISYLNIGMTNVHFPIQVYGYYNEVGTPSSITPYYASTQAVAGVVGTTPVYRDITFSNINATSVSGYPVGIIWSRTELPATNIVFNRVNISGDRNFCLYNVSGAQFIDSKITVSASTTTFALFNAQVIVSNSAPSATQYTFDGLTTNGYANTLTLYNTLASLKGTNVFDDGPCSLSASLLSIPTSLSLAPKTLLNYTLGTTAARLAVTGNLLLGGTNWIAAGTGFTNGTYTLMTYTGTLSGSPPVLASVPTGYSYSFDTSTAGKVNLIVTLLAPTNLVAVGTNLLINLRWNAVNGATSYNLKRGTANNGPYPMVFSPLTATNYSDADVTNAVNYYYVVTAAGAGGESTSSLQASAAPLPSSQPTNIVMQAGGGQLQISWPQDHLGWQLQIQTNDLSSGLGTNWVTVPDSANVISTNIVINPDNGSVFLRLAYP